MKIFLVIGNPIEHSLSPKMFKWIFNALCIDARYQKKCIDKDSVNNIVDDIREGKIDGLNITLPYKESIVNSVDILSPSAEYLKSINCISIENNNVVGHNTDIHGFSYLIEKNNISLDNKKILIVGAGGVSRAVVGSLISLVNNTIFLINRDNKRAKSLVDYFNNLHDDLVVSFIDDKVDIGNFDIIINCTSIGLDNERYDHCSLEGSLKSKSVLIDTLYHQIETPFLKIRNRSCKFINGLDMFIGQGIASLDLWFGNSISNKINSTHLKEYLNSLCLKE